MTKRRGACHADQLTRLRRIEGQVRGVASMIEDKRYCNDILIQLRAIKSAVASVEVNVVEQHMKHCLNRAISAENQMEASEIIDEIKELLVSSLKS